MSQKQSIYQEARALIDAANSADPNQVTADGKEWPKELLYSERMSNMLERYKPDADNAMKLAIRAQHIERWKSPRSAYPMDRIGYLKWRKDLYKIQANRAAELMLQAGFGKVEVERARNAVAKKNIKGNPDTQLLEDVTDLVFMEHYMPRKNGSKLSRRPGTKCLVAPTSSPCPEQSSYPRL
jgi:polyribonucleotide nucleotidyltransferase